MRSINRPLSVRAALGVATLGILALAGPAARAGGNIDTTSQWNGVSRVSNWGVPDTSVFGETITATAGLSTLNSFTFYLEDQNGAGGNIAYTANVYAWDGTKATGASLFTSAAQNTGPLSATAFTAITSSTGSLSLLPGQKYVLFLSTDGLQTGAPSRLALWGQTTSTSAYTGGEFVYQNNAGDGNGITTNAWRGGDGSEGGDLAFTANFGAPVPEATSGASLGLMLCLGLGGVAVARRRKGSASTE